MRMLGGGKFVPGFRVNADASLEDDEFNIEGGEDGGNTAAFNQEVQPVEAAEVPEQAVIRVGHRNSGSSSNTSSDVTYDDDQFSTDGGGSSDDVAEDSEEYETFTRFRKHPEECDTRVLTGTDWESVNYKLQELVCEEDEITGLDVSASYIAVQYYIEGAIDVYDRVSFAKLFRLEGHEYGGQCLKLCEDRGILYSASMDCSLKTWNLKSRSIADSKTDHADYVQCLEVYQAIGDNCDLCATGGKGDKALNVYNVSRQGQLTRKHKLQGHKGWIISIRFLSIEADSPPSYVVSASQGSSIKIWDLGDGSCLQTLEQCAGLTCMVTSPSLLHGHQENIFLFGDTEGKLSLVDLEGPESWQTDNEDYEPDVFHLLPNILIGTGKYCRSCKYHDKAVDVAHLTDNGYLVTASEGSKYVKVWKIDIPMNGVSTKPNVEGTEVRELQLLRDHTDYLSTFCVYSDTIYSSCSDGKVYAHTFPKMSSDSGDYVHYDMAFDDRDEGTTASASLAAFSLADQNNHEKKQFSTKCHDKSTEVCLGPRLCRTGKAGLVRSSSSFQVSFQLKPSVAEVDGKVRLPLAQSQFSSANIRKTIIEEEDSEEEGEEEDDSDEFEIVYVSGSDEESD